MFKIINNLVAIPPDNLQFNQRPHRNKHNKQILVKQSNVDSYKFSFTPRTIIDWNNLAQREVDCQTVNNFKAVLQITD